jgi:hypothetical protein
MATIRVAGCWPVFPDSTFDTDYPDFSDFSLMDQAPQTQQKDLPTLGK